MGLSKIALNLAEHTAKYTKMLGKSSILETKPTTLMFGKLTPFTTDVVKVSKNFELSSQLTERLQCKENGFALFNNQWQEFWKLRKMPTTHKPTPFVNKGDLIHGTSYSSETVESVFKDGIVSGEIKYGSKPIIIEDGETFGCADFFTAPEKTYIKDYFDSFVNRKFGVRPAPERNYLPRTQKFGKNRKIAFVIDTQSLGKDSKILLKNSANPNSLNTSPINGIVDHFPLQYENLQATLVGVPSNYISKVVVGNGVSNVEIENIKLLAKKHNLSISIYDTSGNVL